MGCIRVTPRPSYYRELALMKQDPPEEPTLEDKITVLSAEVALRSLDAEHRLEVQEEKEEGQNP